ncbi:MAG TPA: hypothetical protein VLE44_00150 [Candidatus Saccharimonadales bacterium]|nr:hypothetical protein [Candidatus Saccharimonadales bacterium]
MSKEVFFAVLAGGALGLVIAYGAWRTNAALQKRDNSAISVTANNPSSAPTENFQIALAKPLDMSVITSGTTTVSGITKAKSFVVITGEDSDDISTASDSGTFQRDIDLTAGSNQLKAFAFDNDGNEVSAKVTVVYSSSFQTPQGIFYMGTVTDISNSTIQIKNTASDIQQITPSKDGVTYVKTTGDNVKEVKSTDLAIGDFIIGMGTKDGNNVLVASRILISDPVKPTTRKAFFGTVTDNSTIGKITVKNNKSGESVTVTPSDSIQITGVNRFSQLKTDTKIIAVGELKDGNIDARTIQVLK